jgi:predicted amidophosphoribosyltransferase
MDIILQLIAIHLPRKDRAAVKNFYALQKHLNLLKCLTPSRVPYCQHCYRTFSSDDELYCFACYRDTGKKYWQWKSKNQPLPRNPVPVKYFLTFSIAQQIRYIVSGVYFRVRYFIIFDNLLC